MTTMLSSGFSPLTSLADSRDKIANLSLKTRPLPMVDLKPWSDEVEDQGVFNSCTANAACSALELMWRRRNIHVDLSRLYVYYYVRQLGNLRGDYGAYPRDIGRTLLNYGACSEKTWAYNTTNLETPPSALAIAEAAKYKIKSYEKITGSLLPQFRTALSKGIPILIAMQVHAGMFSLRGNWRRHTWDFNSTFANPSYGGHEVLVIGYDDTCQRLLIENSWGSRWGDGGYFGLPYTFVSSAAMGESWILNQIV